MFHADTCKLCGACIKGCPFIIISTAEAKEEIAKFVKTRDSSLVMKNCAGCGYCNTICPTRSNPADLRKEIRAARIAQAGAGCMALMREDVPENIMTVGLRHRCEEKEEALKKYMNPPKSKAAFYIGCALSYIYTDLNKTKLLDGLPVLGGMKYCCGGYIRNTFGEQEAKFRGEELLKAFRGLGLKKLITFCPECDYMLKKVYPELVVGFDLEIQSIAEYLLEKFPSGEIEFPHRLDMKITLHDSCAWRALNEEIYEAPRKLLELLGAQVVEMKHNRRKSWCCGTPLTAVNPKAAEKAAEKRVAEAMATGAQAIAISCNGCFALNRKASEKNLDVFNITELFQMALGERPPHRISEEMNHMVKNFMQTITANPYLLTKKYRIKNGQLTEC
ncbi:MAG: (Fe-S)-binding protein [Deltaproteobacteria bacterium]|nr:(Fe-S)-binding protein [Deltaproteobacteria bacterium]